MQHVLKVGDNAPEFELENVDENVIRLKDLLANGPLVLSFYRGRW
jgi:peroxiredoxin